LAAAARLTKIPRGHSRTIAGKAPSASLYLATTSLHLSQLLIITRVHLSYI
jgi:hypothetical protein